MHFFVTAAFALISETAGFGQSLQSGALSLIFFITGATVCSTGVTGNVILVRERKQPCGLGNCLESPTLFVSYVLSFRPPSVSKGTLPNTSPLANMRNSSTHLVSLPPLHTPFSLPLSPTCF